MRHFKTQSTKHWFTSDTFAAMHRIRGVECASQTGLADGILLPQVGPWRVLTHLLRRLPDPSRSKRAINCS